VNASDWKLGRRNRCDVLCLSVETHWQQFSRGS
jgi:hypothetical protein